MDEYIYTDMPPLIKHTRYLGGEEDSNDEDDPVTQLHPKQSRLRSCLQEIQTYVFLGTCQHHQMVI